MENKRYNGWSNYATWRVNLEILGDIEYEEEVTEDYLKEIVEDVVFSRFEMGVGSHLVEDYARAFVDDVNYYEIAAAINDGITD
tara:strand:- start:28 stop:279 length:252 start_codon:yes stop_codon:yes gene_type:complete